MSGQKIQPHCLLPLPAPSRQHHTEPSPHLGFNSFHEDGVPPPPRNQKYSPLSRTSLHLVILSQAPPTGYSCGLTRVLFLNANRTQRVKPTASLVPGVNREKGVRFYVEGHIGTMVQEKGVKAEVVGHGKGQWGRGPLVGRREGKILPMASADTDQSRQMKLLLFLKSSRHYHKIFLIKKISKDRYDSNTFSYTKETLQSCELNSITGSSFFANNLRNSTFFIFFFIFIIFFPSWCLILSIIATTFHVFIHVNVSAVRKNI